MNFELDESAAQHAISHLIVFQIEGEYQLNYPEHALLLVEEQEWGRVIHHSRRAIFINRHHCHIVNVLLIYYHPIRRIGR